MTTFSFGEYPYFVELHQEIFFIKNEEEEEENFGSNPIYFLL